MIRRLAPLALVTPILFACSEDAPPAGSEAATPDALAAIDVEAMYEPPPVLCDCELSSWVVVGRGRHLHLDIDCPEEFDHLDGRIEFTSAALRFGFDGALLEPGVAPRLTRMTPGGRLYSPSSEPRPRSEATYEITARTAAWLQRDIAFSEPYILLGSNSNAAMRALLQSAGLEVPESVLNARGMLGEFPGIDQSPGSELTSDQWPGAGLPNGPRTIEGPLPGGWLELGEILPFPLLMRPDE